MSTDGAGSAYDPRVATMQELAAAGGDISEAEKLEQLAVEAEAAVTGAKAKIDKQRKHFEEAEDALEALKVVATKARKAADEASE